MPGPGQPQRSDGSTSAQRRESSRLTRAIWPRNDAQ
jgi:hypothetical protein